MKRSREEQTGVNLEVNGRILDSCTDLMKAIQVLIKRSKELQKEIVAEGMVRDRARPSLAECDLSLLGVNGAIRRFLQEELSLV